jgi:hypothetical protein
MNIIDGFQQMVGYQICRLFKPENGELIKHRTLVWNATGENYIKGRDSVGSY